MEGFESAEEKEEAVEQAIGAWEKQTPKQKRQARGWPIGSTLVGPYYKPTQRRFVKEHEREYLMSMNPREGNKVYRVDYMITWPGGEKKKGMRSMIRASSDMQARVKVGDAIMSQDPEAQVTFIRVDDVSAGGYRGDESDQMLADLTGLDSQTARFARTKDEKSIEWRIRQIAKEDKAKSALAATFEEAGEKKTKKEEEPVWMDDLLYLTKGKKKKGV